RRIVASVVGAGREHTSSSESWDRDTKGIRGVKRDGLAPVVPRRGDYYGPSVPRVLNGRFGRRVSLPTAETQIQEIAPGGQGALDRSGDRKARGARLRIPRRELRKLAEAVESTTRGD